MKRSYIKRKTPLKRTRLKKYGQFTHRDYSVKKDYVKGLKNKAERLWKQLGKLLHGNECEVKKNYPELNMTHTPEIQGDHCISRANKYLFFDIRNHSSICSACNEAKGFGSKSISRAVDEIVKKRHPEWFKDAVWLDQTREANINFSQVWWLEEIVKDLEEMIIEYKQKLKEVL